MHLRLWKCEKSPQTCGFAVAEHLLQFCGIECKFAVPSSESLLTQDHSQVPAVALHANENVDLQMYTSYAQHSGSILHTTFPSH